MIVRRGISVPNMGEAGTIVGLAHVADAAGFDGFFVWDHMQYRRNRRRAVFDPWVLLGAAARETERVRLGPLVTPLARRRPWKVAKELVTLDHLSGGRAVLGVGLGSPDHDEFGAFGEPEDRRERAALLDEGLEVLVGCLSGEAVLHDGEHFTVDVELLPTAIQRPRPPIWVGAVWPRPAGFRRAARWDGVVPISTDGPLTPDELGDALEATGLEAGQSFDIVAPRHNDIDPAEYADAGATWVIDDVRPDDGWEHVVRDLIDAGP